MQIKVDLDLPRDARYVPVMRNMADQLLSDLGAPAPAVADIQLAVSEACANVVRHATGTRTYHVSLVVRDSGCDIEVADSGPGFGRADVGAEDAPDDAENGRGLQLMQALVDDLFVVSDDGDNVVRLRKRWQPLSLAISSSGAGGEEQAAGDRPG